MPLYMVCQYQGRVSPGTFMPRVHCPGRLSAYGTPPGTAGRQEPPLKATFNH